MTHKTWRWALVLAAVLACRAAAADDPLAGLVLDDASGRPRALDELRGRPVLLVIADRRASQQANEWGARLAALGLALAPWSGPGRVAWLSIADLRGVPEYAREDARDRLREREAGRGELERRQCSPLLLDWDGRLAESFQGTRGEALLVLLSQDHRIVHREQGAPADEAVGRLGAAVDTVTPR